MDDRLTAAERHELVALRAQVRDLRKALEARRTRRRQLEQAEALIKVIDARQPGRAFYGGDLLGSDDPVVRAALEAVRVETVRQLGALLRDMCGCDIGGLRVRTVKRDRRGWIWTIARAGVHVQQ